MSYLDHVRLVFAGDFQADISTVNNDVRHYDNATFEQRFQTFLKRPVQNGWWNPIGSGAFRLINCRVRAVHYSDGTSCTEPALDAAVGLHISGSNDRVGAKLVDLDPQWQMSSQIWGLEMRLADDTGADRLAGHFQPAAFQDILFGRDGRRPSAAFQSVLTVLRWAGDLSDSRFLRELKTTIYKDLASVRLTTFGYDTTATSERFTLGTVVGVVGAFQGDDPRSFVLGRRMVPCNGERTADNVNFFDCHVNAKTHTVFADFGNALPLSDAAGTLADIGHLRLAVLHGEEILENQRVVANAHFTPLGSTIPYRDGDWLLGTGGIWAAPFPRKDLELVQTKPLALVKMASTTHGTVAIRESVGGWLIRAEGPVHRVEAGATVQTTLFVAQYGQVSSGQAVIELEEPKSGRGAGPSTDPQPPRAKIPDINTPTASVTLPAEPLTAGNAGRMTLSIQTANPDNPRCYIDGQIYVIHYRLDTPLPVQRQHAYDVIVLLLFDAYEVPDEPTWVDHIQPIMQQYGNLYPIMSQQLINLADYKSVAKHRAVLELVFSLDPSDPNYMPVSRDLSKPKRETILKWLRKRHEDGSYALVHGGVGAAVGAVATSAAVVRPAAAAVVVRPAAAQSEEDGKTAFHLGLQRAEQLSRKP